MKNINVALILLLVIGCASTLTTTSVVEPAKPMTIGTYSSPPRAKDGTIQYDTLISQLKDLHVNMYNWLIMPDKDSIKQLTEFLPIAQKAGIEVWATLIPPVELDGMGLRQYSTSDMRTWAAELAALSVTYPNFKAWAIDDFTHSISLYTPQYVSEFQSAAKKINPAFKFYPVCYYVSIGKNFAKAYGSIIDGIEFPYRDESAGKPDLTDYSHVADEIHTIRNYMGNSLPIFLFVYSSGHHQIGNPIPEYISKVIETGIQSADGVIIYRHPSPRWDAEKYKAVKEGIITGLAEKK